MKQVPNYILVLILFFIYDDIWFTYEEHPVIHTLLILVAVSVAFLYAVGQGPVMRQIVEVLYGRLLALLGAARQKA
jgi:hypothetical protein